MKLSDLKCPWPKCDGIFRINIAVKSERYVMHQCKHLGYLIEGKIFKTAQKAMKNWMSWIKK